jgi:hypothetical protein
MGSVSGIPLYKRVSGRSFSRPPRSKGAASESILATPCEQGRHFGAAAAPDGLHPVPTSDGGGAWVWRGIGMASRPHPDRMETTKGSPGSNKRTRPDLTTRGQVGDSDAGSWSDPDHHEADLGRARPKNHSLDPFGGP